MLSLQRISKGTAVALAVGAFAAPVASAEPFGGIPSQAKQLSPSTQVARPTTGDPSVQMPDTPYGHRALGSPSYSRLAGVATSQISPRPILPAWASSGAAASQATVAPKTGGGSDWGYAGIGAGGVLVIVAIGGGLVLVERRARRTETTALATS
jgi:hypothetical protein